MLVRFFRDNAHGVPILYQYVDMTSGKRLALDLLAMFAPVAALTIAGLIVYRCFIAR